MKNNNNQTLLTVLKGLYHRLSQISLSNTRARVRSYQRIFKSQVKVDIISILNEQVEMLAVTEQVQVMEVTDSENSHDLSSADSKHRYQFDKSITNQNFPERKFEKVNGVESEFTKYLKQHTFITMTEPHLGESLKLSVWEHIHCAIRHA